MRAVRRRVAFFFKQRYWQSLAIVAAVLGGLAAHFASEHPVFASFIAGVSASVLATVVVSLAGPAGEKAYQDFLSLGVTTFFSSRNKVPNDEWVNRLKQARERCILLGQAHGNWCEDDRFEPALIDRLTNGVQVEMFFLNPNETAAQVRSKEDGVGVRDTRRRIRRSIKFVWGIREGLPQPAKGRLTLWVYDATPSLGVTWIDAEMLVTHYLAGATNLTSPALVVEPRPGPDTIYAVYAENVNKIRATFSEKVTTDNIAKYAHEETDGHAA
jgi:hypothetical protein